MCCAHDVSECACVQVCATAHPWTSCEIRAVSIGGEQVSAQGPYGEKQAKDAPRHGTYTNQRSRFVRSRRHLHPASHNQDPSKLNNESQPMKQMSKHDAVLKI